MAIIGFIAILLLGIYLCFAGAARDISLKAFTGRSDWGGSILIILGAVLVVVAGYNSPFAVSIK